MNILQLLKEALAVIQALDPGVKATVETGKNLVVIGSTVFKVLQKGKQLSAYVLTSRKKTVEGAAVAGLEPIPEGEPIVTKDDVAIVVDISRRLLRNVGQYLEEQKIDADVIVLTNDAAFGDVPKFLDPKDTPAWVELAQDFNAGMSRVKAAVGAARVHIFLGTPLPLAFGMGAVWGTVDNATVYHWQDNTYYPVMPISRKLRGA